jgi:hypothetical protein
MSLWNRHGESMRKTLFIALALFATPVVAQEFTPFEMEDMEKSAASGCIQDQVKKPENRAASAKLMVSYCQCFGRKFAAMASKAEMTEIEKFGMREHNLEKIREISEQCRAEIVH